MLRAIQNILASRSSGANYTLAGTYQQLLTCGSFQDVKLECGSNYVGLIHQFHHYNF